MTETNGNLTAKDFRTDQEVRWCPGCGDYAILASLQSFMPELGISRENTVFVSGRSEERRVGKECHTTCRSRWSPYH